MGSNIIGCLTYRPSITKISGYQINPHVGIFLLHLSLSSLSFLLVAAQ